MPNFLSDDRYTALLDALQGAVVTACTTAAELRDLMAEALACADILPEGCRADFEGLRVVQAA
ncbi:hypothetical protein [Fuscibacter oryzae]|uniref:Uncharacterized protein n=1 Tax=Fuscibacter oryzae TaxID=2803939 RepID=A0A8J7SS16_9RHOB|nr:hypothetical protein [Fuscibacter oryzae]MBL4928011.1 hypothetical protein [Fuscibacter oryzae]